MKERAPDRVVAAAIFLSAALFGLRFHLAGLVGFGDAEALYAAYALHPQPAYLDHPGLVGVIARFLGHDGAPTPETVHRFTAVAATALPWLGLVVSRMLGSTWRAAFIPFFALALWPETSIGLFALTPDLPLAVTWMMALGLAGLSLSASPGSRTALMAMVAAGLFTGLAMTAKASGVLLLVALAVTLATKPGRGHLKTAGPWCALGVALILASPVFFWERQHGWPLLVHRLVTTQTRAGFSLRNLGALLGGQLLYVTPPFLVAAYRVLRALSRRESASDRLLFVAAVVPGVPLAILCLWSRVAEPHWMAPAYLSLAFGAARTGVEGPRLRRLCFGVGIAVVAAGFLSVATPVVAQVSGARYVPKYDLTNDLYSWQAGLPLLKDEVDALVREGKEPVVVGPHWTICAQVHAALGDAARVGCQTPGGDDFSGWFPENTWSSATTLLFVTDDRFPADPAREFPRRDVVQVRSAHVFRGGKLVRTIRIARLDKGAVATR